MDIMVAMLVVHIGFKQFQVVALWRGGTKDVLPTVYKTRVGALAVAKRWAGRGDVVPVFVI